MSGHDAGACPHNPTSSAWCPACTDEGVHPHDLRDRAWDILVEHKLDQGEEAHVLHEDISKAIERFLERSKVDRPAYTQTTVSMTTGEVTQRPATRRVSPEDFVAGYRPSPTACSNAGHDVTFRAGVQDRCNTCDVDF